jgi:hypothetical protein
VAADLIQKYGPGNGKIGFTPNRIKCWNWGWTKEKFPEFDKGHRVRVIPGLVDQQWEDLLRQFPQIGLRKDYPRIVFHPAIWYEASRQQYVCGLQVGRVLHTTLWYASVGQPGTIYSWGSILPHEMKHILCGELGGEQFVSEAIP